MRSPVPLLLGSLLLAPLAAGCLHHTFEVGAGAPDGEVVYRAWHHHWLFGTIRPDHQKLVEVDEVCPSGDATIREKTSFLNGLIDVLVGVVYSPTTVVITCDDGSRTATVLSPEQVEEVVGDPRFLPMVEELLPERLAEAENGAHRLAGARDRPTPTLAP